MKKKGFTLVELLAVVVVLAIVSIIAIPIIIGIIDNTKRNALKHTAEGLLKSAEYYYDVHKMKGDLAASTEFSIQNNKAVGDNKLNYKGSVDNAYVLLFSDGASAICVDDNEYSASKAADSKEIIVSESVCTGEFDEATKSYITSGTHNYGELTLNIKAYTSISKLPTSARNNDLGVITTNKITGYFVGYKEPETKKEGMIWVVSKITTGTDLNATKSVIPINYAVQYISGEWIIKDSYLYSGDKKEWQRLEFYDKSEYVYNYEYSGHYEEFTAPHTGTYQIELWGASGGTNSGSYPGGLGAYTKGDIYLTEGEKLYVYVGRAGDTSTASWNGGGAGQSGGSGGGATDVRLVATSSATTWNEFNSLKSRIMVAAGAGGGATYDNDSWRSSGGAGGALAGGTPVAYGTSSAQSGYLGSAGTQTTGGSSSAGSGGFGYGGNASGNGYNAGGGGGGYYGGSGGYHAGNAGAGGSSFISGYEGCNAINENSSENASSIIHTGQSVHESGKKFDNGEMYPGVRSGHGRATITFKAFGEYNPKKPQMEVGDTIAYNYVGGYQALHITTSGTYKIELWGASGGTNSGTYPGGKGAYTKGEIYLESGDTIYIFIGGKGMSTGGKGYNGGGFGYSAGGGGGATDVRVNISAGDWNTFDSLKNRIMVAGGGGGGATYDNDSWRSAGGAGGTIGLAAPGISVATGTGISYLGTGGTQTAGGSSSAGSGGFGYGGNHSGNSYNAAGGGGGWYGGGGGYHAGGGAGGGSSYISGHPGCNAVRDTSTASNILHLGVSDSPTGYKFINTEIKTGVNEGNGKALITLVSKNRPAQSYPIQDVYTFEYDGSYVPFIIPRTGYYQVELWGAQGGSQDGTYRGGFGGYTSGKIHLNKGTVLFVYVGGQPTGKAGSPNGGGGAATDGTGGGGATDVRTIAGSANAVQSYASRIMVAGAGGGGANYDSSSWRARGGAGGGLIGYETDKIGSSNYIATGGTQTAGGTSSAGAGGFGYGGNSSSNSGGYRAGSGGSGWYGGAGSYHAGGGGAGGSSYISGHAGCIGVDKNGTPNASTYSTLSDSYSNTGYKFTDTVMIDGNGYAWTTTKASTADGMPDYDGVQIKTGNQGNGYAKFTYLGD